MFAFAEIGHSESYYDFYEPLLAHIKERFAEVQSGVQGDAWIWIFEDGVKVAIDTFYSMQFEIHAEEDSPVLRAVIAHVGEKYSVQVYAEPREY